MTIATPYKGSVKSVEALLPGARNLFGVENQKSMRHAARTLPGVYQLLPRWPGAVVDRATGQPLNIYNEANWQRSIVDGLAKRFPLAGGTSFFQSMLTDAGRFTGEVSKPWPQKLRSRVFTAVGVETETWWQVPVDRSQGNLFRFDEGRLDPQGSNRGGDGTVHTASSILDEISPRHRHKDTKRFKDSVLGGHHANMPNHGGVQDWVLQVLKLNPHSDNAFESPE